MKALWYDMYLCLYHINSALKNNAVLVKLKNWETLVIYILQTMQQQRVIESLPRKVTAVLESTKQAPSIGAAVDLYEQERFLKSKLSSEISVPLLIKLRGSVVAASFFELLIIGAWIFPFHAPWFWYQFHCHSWTIISIWWLRLQSSRCLKLLKRKAPFSRWLYKQQKWIYWKTAASDGAAEWEVEFYSVYLWRRLLQPLRARRGESHTSTGRAGRLVAAQPFL